MATGTESDARLDTDPERVERPDISLCESRPGKAVFLEAGNTDGWIATDATVDVER